MEQPSDTLSYLRPFLPKLREWVDSTVTAHSAEARSPASLGSGRLSLYFPGASGAQLLSSARFVPVDDLPKPPLGQWGLEKFRWFEELASTAVTYGHTYFVKRAFIADEGIHLHELVHVLQWWRLGFENFALFYALGLLECGYRDHVFEVLAYDHHRRFLAEETPYDVGLATAQQMNFLFPSGPQPPAATP